MGRKRKKIKYNIFKILKEKESELSQELKGKGLDIVKKMSIKGYELIFYFSKVPDKIPIWWTETYNEFLEGITEKPKNEVYYGVLLISGKNICYGISLGKSHFYLRKFCDKDFGLNLAERIADVNNLKIKNSRYFKSKKNRSITAYQDGSEFEYDSGESLYFLKSQTINSDIWGKYSNFGNSVLFYLNIKPKELPDFLETVEAELKNKPRFFIPRTEIIKDELTIKELDKKLAEEISKVNSPATVNIDEFSVSGVDFIFKEQTDFCFYLNRNSKDKSDPDELTMENLRIFIDEMDLDIHKKINEIKVFIRNEFGRSYIQPLKYYLDFVYENDRSCLIDGKWHRFNKRYLDYLKMEVDRIGYIYNEKFDIDANTNEPSFNKKMEKYGFINFDKKIEQLDKRYKVEKMDLYKDNSLYFVKIGTPQKLSYVIDQALNTVKLLQNNESNISIDNEIKSIKKIYLWLIVIRKNNIKKISELKSLILLMKLDEWRKIVRNAGYEAIININYKR